MFKYKILPILILLVLFSLNPKNVFAKEILGPAPHFIVDEDIDITSEVNGDMVIMGRNITISKPVNGDLFIMGENVSIDAPVSGDVRIASSTIEIKSQISGSLGFLADKVIIPVSGEISKDAYGISQTFSLFGRVGGDLNLGYADESDILIDGNVVGNIHYLNKLPNVTSKAFLGGKLVKTDTSDYEVSQEEMRFQIIISKIIHSLSLILIAILIIRFLPKKFTSGFELYKNNIPKNILYGLLAFLVLPLCLFVLFISVIGIPIGLLSLAFFMFLIYISPVYPAFYIGDKLLPQSKNLILKIVCGIFIFDVISMGPIIGSVLNAFSILSFIGLVFKFLLGLRREKISK